MGGHHPPPETENEMSDAYQIQIGKKTVGLVVRHGGEFRFYASDPAFSRLEGAPFRRVREVEHAAARLEAVLRRPHAKAQLSGS